LISISTWHLAENARSGRNALDFDLRLAFYKLVFAYAVALEGLPMRLRLLAFLAICWLIVRDFLGGLFSLVNSVFVSAFLFS